LRNVLLKKEVMAINKVWIEEGCTACELCVDICPEVFKMGDDTAVVMENTQLDVYEDEVIDAAESCPVDVIRYQS
jgi:ferredoxin